MLTRTLEMPVEDAFSLASTFLTNQLEETSQANTDEMFCLSLSLSSSSPHPLEIVASCLETRPPLSSSMPPTNSISGMALSGLCTVEQLFPLLVPSSGLLPQLDTQTLHTGKFVLSWRRVDAFKQVESIVARTSVNFVPIAGGEQDRVRFTNSEACAFPSLRRMQSSRISHTENTSSGFAKDIAVKVSLLP